MLSSRRQALLQLLRQAIRLQAPSSTTTAFVHASGPLLYQEQQQRCLYALSTSYRGHRHFFNQAEPFEQATAGTVEVTGTGSATRADGTQQDAGQATVRLATASGRGSGSNSMKELRQTLKDLSAKGGIEACLAHLSKVSADPYAYNYLMARLHPEGSVRILAAMAAHEIQPDSYTVALAIARAPTATAAHAIYEKHLVIAAGAKLLGRGPIVTHQMVASLCSAYGREGKPDIIRNIMAENKSSGLPVPPHCYSSLIQAYGRCRNLVAARSVIDDMARAGVPVNDEVVAALISCFAELGRAADAREAWHALRSQGIRPGVKAYSSLINVYATARMPKQAAAVMQEMRDNGVEPSKGSYTALLKAWARVNDIGQIRAIIAEMTRAKIRVDAWAWTNLMYAYATSCQPAKAREVLAEMRARGEKPNVVAYTTLISAYAKVADVAGARAAMADMQAAGVQPTVITWTNLMSCAARAGDYAACKAIMAEMTAAGVKPDPVARKVLVEAAMQCWDDSGRQGPALAEAQAMFQELPVLRMPVHWSVNTTDPGPKFGRAGKGAIVDLHLYNHWTCQLALLTVLQTLLRKRQQNKQEPHTDLKVITGRGNRSASRFHSVIRDVAMRFLQGLVPVTLAPGNEGILVVRQRPLADLLDHFISRNYAFDPLTLQHNFVSR